MIHYSDLMDIILGFIFKELCALPAELSPVVLYFLPAFADFVLPPVILQATR